MINLFKNEKPKRATRVARVESLNPEKGISQSMRASKDQREYVVCLCLVDKTIKTTFLNKWSALDQMKKNRQLYKEIKKRNTL